MKHYHELTETEKYKLQRVGLLWEIYPEQLNKFFSEIIPCAEEPDNPEMVAFLKEIENHHYPREQFGADICHIGMAWQKQMESKRQ